MEGADEYVTDPNEFVDVSASLAILTKDIADRLEAHYPGWLWAVAPFEWGGIIKIFSLRISGQYGYIMKIADIQYDPRRQLAVEAGGEILERYGLPRGPYRRELLRGRMRDLVGNLIPDITDKDGRVQRRDRDRRVTQAVNEGALKLRAVDRTDEAGNTYREISMQITGDSNAESE